MSATSPDTSTLHKDPTESKGDELGLDICEEVVFPLAPSVASVDESEASFIICENIWKAACPTARESWAYAGTSWPLAACASRPRGGREASRNRMGRNDISLRHVLSALLGDLMRRDVKTHAPYMRT